MHGAELAVHLRKAGPPLRVALPAGLDQRPVSCRQVVWHGRPHAVEHLVQDLRISKGFSGIVPQSPTAGLELSRTSEEAPTAPCPAASRPQ